MPRIINETKDTVVAEDLRLAESLWSRFWGLMGRKSLPEGSGLLLKPASSIHTAFMRFAIDVVFLDRSLKVVKVVPALKPYRATIAFGGAYSALELNADAAAAARVEKGDQLAVVEAGGPRLEDTDIADDDNPAGQDEELVAVDTAQGTMDNRSDP